MKQFIIKVWNYVRPAWEDDDSKLSYRRASQFLFLGLATFMVKGGKVDTKYGFYSFVAILITFLLLAGLITAQQLISGVQEINKLKVLGTVAAEPTKTTEVSDQP